MKEGVIKFHLDWNKKPLPGNLKLNDVVMFRNMLASHGLIGSDNNGIGYGNISVLIKPAGFVISGSGTGAVKSARKFHFTLVINADIKKNLVACTGLYPASSESITHDMIYRLSPSVKSVIHVHNMLLWKKLLNKVPTTSDRITYGTQEMAYEIRRLWNKSGLKEKKILIMGGHEGGLIVFGESIKEAYGLLMKYYSKILH